MNATFKALHGESLFTREMLLAGLEQIRKANYGKRGMYFQSFISLSTGLERIGKLAIILDYYITNGGHLPDFKYLKSQIGHDLEMIYQKSIEIVKSNNISFKYLSLLSDPVHIQIINVLSAFAKGDRYSNIDLLTNVQQINDPIAVWFKKVDTYILKSIVSENKKGSVKENALQMKQIPTTAAFVVETGDLIYDIEALSTLTGNIQLIAPFRHLFMGQVIRYWAEIMVDLQYKAMSLKKSSIPYLNEIFGIFICDDKTLKKTRCLWKLE